MKQEKDDYFPIQKVSNSLKCRIDRGLHYYIAFKVQIRYNNIQKPYF